MGLTKSSTGTHLLENNYKKIKNKDGYTIALAGNPNVGKSTIFNALTGMHQHTGNWPGKTISNATGKCIYNKPDSTVIVVDATCLERNLNLVFQIMEITNNIIVCVNLLDEAKKKKINVNLDKLSKRLGVPVVRYNCKKKENTWRLNGYYSKSL